MKISKTSCIGFTIVELLTVITVLAILVTVVTVGYPALKGRANTDKARSHALSVQKIAESYYEEKGRFPGTTSEFTELSTKLSSSITLLTGSAALSSSNAGTSIDYDYVGGSSTEASGVRIRYWDYQKSGGAGIADDVIYLGTANSSTPSGSFNNLAS